MGKILTVGKSRRFPVALPGLLGMILDGNVMEHSSPRELFPLLDSPDLEERLNAIRALGEMGDPEALAVLRTRRGPPWWGN
jgi:HEAT repeat protein